MFKNRLEIPNIIRELEAMKEKKNKTEILKIKNITEIKNSIDGWNNIIRHSRKQVSELKERLVVVNVEAQREKNRKWKINVR